MRQTRERAEERAERSQLRIFFEEVIRRQLERGGASSSTMERHAAAVEHVERFVKQPLAPDDVDEELIAKFDSYLWRQGTSDGRRRDLTESLRRICRAYDPGRATFAKKCERRPLPDPPAGSVRHFYETVDVPQRLVGRTVRYIDDNRIAFWRLYEHYGRDVMLDEQSDALAADHFGWLLERGIRASTINSGHMAPWFATWRHAYRVGLVDRLPGLKKLPTIEEEPDSWTLEEMRSIFAACAAASPRPIAGVPAGPWWEAMLRVLWYTALRRRAIMGLRRADVDLRTGWIRVPARLMKNGRGQSFRIGADAIAAVKAIWEPTRELLFPFPHDQTCFYTQFRRIVAAAGLKPGRYKLSALHKVRRSVATEVARHQGVGAAQTILGHSDQRVTLRYLDPSKLPGADFSELLSAVNRKPAPAPTTAAG
jgi:integrase